MIFSYFFYLQLNFFAFLDKSLIFFQTILKVKMCLTKTVFFSSNSLDFPNNCVIQAVTDFTTQIHQVSPFDCQNR